MKSVYSFCSLTLYNTQRVSLTSMSCSFLVIFYTQQALTSSPLLVLSNYSKHFEVVCVTSITGIGAARIQEGRPVAFETKKMCPAECTYTAGEQGLFAVFHAMRTWQCCLEGVKFTVITDQYPNVYLQNQADLSRHQVRWSEYLQAFRFRWQYRPGRITIADPFSRFKLHWY